MQGTQRMHSLRDDHIASMLCVYFVLLHVMTDTDKGIDTASKDKNNTGIVIDTVTTYTSNTALQV